MDGAAARADLLLPPHSPIRSQPGAWASPNPSWVAGPLALAGKECADPRAVPRAALDVERGRKTIHGLPTNVPPLPSPLPRPYSACIFFRTSPRLSKPLRWVVPATARIVWCKSTRSTRSRSCQSLPPPRTGRDHSSTHDICGSNCDSDCESDCDTQHSHSHLRSAARASLG